MRIDDPENWDAWFAAAANPAVDAALRAVYDDLALEVAQRGPACWASGRCCRFEKFGHRLYVTALEAAWCLARARAEPALRSLAEQAVEPRGDCPFHVDSLCRAHLIRPLGCRAFFCERGTEEWQHALYEKCQERLRVLHESRGIPYLYAEWRALLIASRAR